MSLTLTTPPTGEPITLAELKAHLRLSDASEDALLEGLALAARQMVEAQANLAIMRQSWAYEIDAARIAGGYDIDLPLAPFVAVDAITAHSAKGAGSPVAPDLYTVQGGNRGVIQLRQPVPNSERLTIDFTVGWASADDAPGPLRLAVKQLAAFWFEHREADCSMIDGVAALIAPWRRVRL